MHDLSKRYFWWSISIIALVGILFLLSLSALSLGEINMHPVDALKLLFLEQSENSIEQMLITQVRLPRILLGIAVGGSLSLAGVILQGIYRNPLVEPFTLGISGGASLGVSLCIVMGLQASFGSAILPLSGFAGAMITIFLVYSLSVKHARVEIQRMLLIGVMISFIASSGIMFIMATTSTENLQGIIFWTMGSLDESNTTLIHYTLGISIASLVLSYLFAQPLNAMRLGEEKAQHLGINTNLTVKILFLLTSLLTGICVAVAGVIGFVGLIIPHLLRLLFGSDYRILLINSFLLGACFLVGCDMIARTIISPNELPIGVITGIIGGIVFIFIMSRKK
ncbi:MAG: FecCD family ABC transporter permease [Mangrovibacterium sp.]